MTPPLEPVPVPDSAVAELIRDRERQRTQALVAKDLERAARMHAPDYQLVTPAGRTFDRAGYLDAIRTGDLTYVSWDPGAMDVRVGADMAIVQAAGRCRAAWRASAGQPDPQPSDRRRRRLLITPPARGAA